VSPPPVTDEKLCAPWRAPSDATKASRSSFGCVVLNAGEEIDVLAVDWWVLTTTSTVGAPSALLDSALPTSTAAARRKAGRATAGKRRRRVRPIMTVPPVTERSRVSSRGAGGGSRENRLAFTARFCVPVSID
jgi:hypothetical protein